MDYFNPYVRERPCWHCRDFVALVAGGVHAMCVGKHGRHVEANPARGCTWWQREPGIDDEPGPPRGFRPVAQVPPGDADSRLRRALRWDG